LKLQIVPSKIFFTFFKILCFKRRRRRRRRRRRKRGEI